MLTYKQKYYATYKNIIFLSFIVLFMINHVMKQFYKQYHTHLIVFIRD